MQLTPYQPWSEERKQAMRDRLSWWKGKRGWLVEQMWADGCTFSEIGGAIGTTRSAVAGYIRRRGLHRKYDNPSNDATEPPVAAEVTTTQVSAPQAGLQLRMTPEAIRECQGLGIALRGRVGTLLKRYEGRDGHVGVVVDFDGQQIAASMHHFEIVLPSR